MKRKTKLFALTVGMLGIGAYVTLRETALPEWVGPATWMGRSAAGEEGWVVEYVDGSGNPIQPSASSASTLANAVSGWRNWFAQGGSASPKPVSAPRGSGGTCQSVPGSSKRR